MAGPKLAVDNEGRDAARERRAIRRLNRTKPDHTYDDVLAEIERMKQEESNEQD